MKPSSPLGNASLLALLTAAIASCGSGDQQTSGSSSSASGSESQTSASQSSATGTGGNGGASGAGGGGAGGHTGGAGGAGGAISTASNSTAASGAGGIPTPRRPFLVGSSLRSAGAVPRADWSQTLSTPTPALDAATADLLAQSWLKDALEEHASVAAFARFTMHLLSVGAPPDLVERSQRASLDEIRHARACFTLAARYSGRASGPSPLVVHDALGALSLAEIAALTAEEGCVGETLGAALAREQLAGAADPEVIAVLRRLVADEDRHAELAWRFVKWATKVGGAEVERAVAGAVERAIAATARVEIRSYAGIDLAAWHAHGRLTCLESRAAAERAIREIVRPCLAMVLEGAVEDGDRALSASAASVA